jgi:hypothetical protein
MHNYHLFLLYSVRSNTVQRNAISSMYHNNMSRIRHMHAQAAAAMEKIKRNRSEYEDGEEATSQDAEAPTTTTPHTGRTIQRWHCADTSVGV